MHHPLSLTRPSEFFCFAATLSNFENHPRLILARDRRSVPRIKLHPKTGMPVVTEDGDHDDAPDLGRTARPMISAREEVLGVAATESRKSDSWSDVTGISIDWFFASLPRLMTTVARRTIARPRNESKEDKKARKEAVRNEKQVDPTHCTSRHKLTWVTSWEGSQGRKIGYERGIFRGATYATQGRNVYA